MENPIKIILAEDQHIVLEGLEALVKTAPDIQVVGLAHNGHHALQVLNINKDNVDIAVLDLEMPVMDGLEAAKKIKIEHPEVKILILSMYKNVSFIKKIIQAGASGYILKNKGSHELLSAIRAIQAGEEYFGDKVKETLIESARQERVKKKRDSSTLTRREKDVLRLTGQGLSSKEMAEELHISTATIETHIRNLLDKLEARNRMELVRYAVENGYLDNEPKA
ncbi:MAG TPA: DNA-binding response regulator [Microscillaceae bacterium]|nr:DNA-binding response regulator [Microscillaceae bacterium]